MSVVAIWKENLMFATCRITLVLTAILAANLSYETVTRETLNKKEFPIRVTVSPDQNAGKVRLRIEYSGNRSCSMRFKVRARNAEDTIANVRLDMETNSALGKSTAEITPLHHSRWTAR
jgi:hypothetical protein